MRERQVIERETEKDMYRHRPEKTGQRERWVRRGVRDINRAQRKQEGQRKNMIYFFVFACNAAGLVAHQKVYEDNKVN